MCLKMDFFDSVDEIPFNKIFQENIQVLLHIYHNAIFSYSYVLEYEMKLCEHVCSDWISTLITDQ